MDIHQLEALAAVAREGGVGRAAVALRLTQPAVTRRLLSLAEESGQPLLERVGRRSRLTPAGQLLLETAHQVLRAVGDGHRALQELAGLARGHLALGSSDTTAIHLLPRHLRRFLRRYPGIEISLRTAPSREIARALREGGLDLGLVTLPVTEPDLEAVPLCREEMIVVAPPRHPLARPSPRRLADLSSFPLILLPRGTTTRTLIDEALARHQIRSQATMEPANIEVIKALVASGLGLSIVPRRAAREELRRGRLLEVRLRPNPFHRDLAFVHRRGAPLPPAARAFLALVLEGERRPG